MIAAGARASWPAVAWKWLVLIILAVAAVAIAERWLDHAADVPQAPPLAPESLRAGYGPRSYDEAVAAANGKVRHWRERTLREGGDWVLLEGLAEALATRFRLAGDYADLAEADRLLDRAMALAPAPSGPVLTRAAVSLSIHRLEAAEVALRRLDAWAVPPSAAEREVAQSLRCEIALQRGDLNGARNICAEGTGSASRLRLANIAAKSGQFAEAARIAEDVLRQPRHAPETLAVLALIRASIALESGDWETAGRWVRAADSWFPGYWLAEAYLAQQHALEGEPQEAARRFAALARRTGNPEVIDAYLRLLGPRADKAEVAQWAGRASRGWKDRAELLPEAAAAHYAAHLFAWGEPAQALALAAREYRHRPTASAASTYAAALTREGRLEEALAILRDTQARGWNTAELKLQQSSLLKALGRKAEAEKAWAEATALNPRVGDAAQRYLAFYQH